MRALLDENLPHKLRSYFEDNVDVVTVSHRGWKGKENGELLKLAAAEFNAFITMDLGIPDQQNLHEMTMGIIVLEAESNRLEDLLPLIPQLNTVLKALQSGQVIHVTTQKTARY